MARSSRSSAAVETPGDESVVSTPAPSSRQVDHSFTLQAIMELQKSFGRVEAKVDGLSSTLCDLKAAQDETRKKVSSTERVIYASGVVLVLTIAAGGWLLNTAKDVAMTYYKATVEAQAKAAATAPPPAAKPTK